MAKQQENTMVKMAKSRVIGEWRKNKGNSGRIWRVIGTKANSSGQEK